MKKPPYQKKFTEKKQDKAKDSRKVIKQVYIFSFVAVMVSVVTLVLVTWYVLIVTGALSMEYLTEYGGLFLALFIFLAIGLSVGLSVVVSKFVLKPINVIINGMSRLSDGDYSVRIALGGYEDMKNLAESFNNLAAELENTEILRRDFINDFSHEFKTPIMSIRGLATMLQKGNVPPEKQNEYLEVIAAESDRLCSLATNVLNLTKVENQSILSNVTKFNLSEQIRDCFLLLEKKWIAKKLELSVDFDDVEYVGDEDLMMQVWYNLLDNAVKFANDGGELGVTLEKTDSGVRVCVFDEGAAIAPENYEKIFGKFYQQDSSHAGEGNGIGLSVVKHIVELHGGTVKAESKNGITYFTVDLPARKE